jgi:hypothetical protein
VNRGINLNFPDKLRTCWLLKKDTAPWIQFISTQDMTGIGEQIEDLTQGL